MHWPSLEIQSTKNSIHCFSFIQAVSFSQKTSFRADVPSAATDVILSSTNAEGQQMQRQFFGSCWHPHLAVALILTWAVRSFSPWYLRKLIGEGVQVTLISHPLWDWNLGLFVLTLLQWISPQAPFYCNHSLIISLLSLLSLTIFHEFCYQINLSPLWSLMHVGCCQTNVMFKEMPSSTHFQNCSDSLFEFLWHCAVVHYPQKHFSESLLVHLPFLSLTGASPMLFLFPIPLAPSPGL